MTSRRTLLCGAAALGAGAIVPRAIGQRRDGAPLVFFVSSNTVAGTAPFLAAFLEGMRQAGQDEGRTFRIETRYADGQGDRLAALTRDAVAQGPAVLLVAGLTGARLARDATSSIPIVVATSSDLADAGIVQSLSRPGGNVTGVSDLADESAGKRLELIKSALPKATQVALIVNPEFPATPKIERRVQATAQAMGLRIVRLDIRDRTGLVVALGSLEKAHVDAILVGGDTLAPAFASELIERAAALRIPVVHYWPGTAEKGALLSYQVDIEDNFRRAAGYVAKILTGEKPGDLPIYQPTRYELVVNAEAARALGITFPPSFLLRADRMIE